LKNKGGKMNICHDCGTENQENNVHCCNCGKQLLFPCVACKKKHLPGLKICPVNGKNIDEQYDMKRKRGKLITIILTAISFGFSFNGLVTFFLNDPLKRGDITVGQVIYVIVILISSFIPSIFLGLISYACFSILIEKNKTTPSE
jgi:hypothetical protein